MSITPATKPRLASLDQFRGYTVAGMFLVNFLGGYQAWMPPILLHHHNYCSYADTIMPQFLFAVGFAMRLSFGRHVQTEGLKGGYWRMVRRIVGLFLVCFAIYTSGRAVANWNELVGRGTWDVVWPYLKREWVQTLGHIALTSLWILPVIRARGGVRIAFALLSGAAHVVLSHWFNYHWTNTDPNGVDGGPLGFLTWTIPAILGTLTCDVIVDAPGRPPLARLTFAALLIMAVGYVFSCGTRLYDLSPAQLVRLKEDRKAQEEEKHKIDDQLKAIKTRIDAHWKDIKKTEDEVTELRRARLQKAVAESMAAPGNAERSRRELIDEAERNMRPAPADSPLGQREAKLQTLHQGDAEAIALESQIVGLRAKLRTFIDVKLAPSPVIPPEEAWRGRTWSTLLAEPPFVQPPADDPRVDAPPYDMHRYWNYWMMTQRGGSLSYLTFGAGFSLLVYVLFYVLSDRLGLRVGVFRTFGTNALAAYILEGIVGSAVKDFIPRDAPQWYTIGGFCVFFYLVWLFVRTMEKNKIYLRV
jgi:predicted acyltransferase